MQTCQGNLRCLFFLPIRLLWVAAGLMVAAQPERPEFAVDLASDSRLGSGWQVHGVAGGPSGVYLMLARGPRVRDPVIALTDEQGAIRAIATLPPGDYGNGLAVDGAGNVYLLRVETSAMPPVQRLVKVAPDGRELESISVPEWLEDLCVSGGALYGLSSQGKVYKFKLPLGAYEEVARPFQVGSGPLPLRLAAFSESKLAVVNLLDNRVWIVDVRDGSAKQVEVNADGVRKPDARVTGGQVRGTLVYLSATGSGNGQVYLAAGRYNYAEGLPVVRLEADGRASVVRLGLAQFAELRHPQHNPLGAMSASKIAVAGGKLFAVDTGGKLAVYRLLER